MHLSWILMIVKNNYIKNTEMIFTLYIPSWDIHNIKVKLEHALFQQSEYSALYIRSSVTLFYHITLMEQLHSLNMADLFRAFYWIITPIPRYIATWYLAFILYGGQVSRCNISWDRSYNSTKGSEQVWTRRWRCHIQRMESFYKSDVAEKCYRASYMTMLNI